MNSLQRKLLFGGIWLGFSAYAFLLAPPNDPNTLEQIKHLSTGQWGQLNPTIVALFNLMGVWPMIYAAVALSDGHGQALATEDEISNPKKSLKAWPFVAGSFGLGAFALLPYLALRAPATTPLEETSRWLKFVTSRLFGLFLLANAMLWMGYGLTQGDWSNFLTQFHSSRFIHVMSLDFCMLTLLFPVLAQDDARRQGIASPLLTWLTVAVPIIGAGIYLVLRPQLPASSAPSSTTKLV